VGQLSGGERRRLQLLQILAKAPNVCLRSQVSDLIFCGLKWDLLPAD
jgi:ABC-type lipopolysaccharide export system ATPase subunit